MENDFILKTKPVLSIPRMQELVWYLFVFFAGIVISGLINVLLIHLFGYIVDWIPMGIGVMLTIIPIIFLRRKMTGIQKGTSYIIHSDRVEVLSPHSQQTMYLKEVAQITLIRSFVEKKEYDDIGTIRLTLSDNNTPFVLANIPNAQEVYDRLLSIHEKSRGL